MAKARNSHVKGRRHGKIFELPDDLRREINALIVQPKITYDDVVAFLKGRGAEASRSAVGRYAAWFFNEVRETEMLREQAQLLTNDPDKALLLDKLTSTMIVKRLALALQNDKFDVMKNAKLIDAYSKLQKSNIQREQWSHEIQKQVKKVADDVQKIAKKNGLSESAAEQIRNKILGISK